MSIVLVRADDSKSERNGQDVLQETSQKLKNAKAKQQEPGGHLPSFKKENKNSDYAQEDLSSESGDIYIGSVALKGATVFSDENFQHCIVKIKGKSVSENALAALTDCMTKVYLDEGYSLSRAVIPPQDVDGGRLLVQIVEGYITSYKVEGGARDQFNIDPLVAPLFKDRPLKLKNLERVLLLLNDVSGLTIRDTALEEKGELSGQFELVLMVDYWKVWSSSSMDNRGSVAVGPLQSYSSIYFNSLFFQGDSIGLSFSSIPDSDDEFRFGSLSFSVPLGGSGVTLSGYVNGSETRPSDEREIVNTKYKYLSGGLNINYALYRSREFSAWIGGGLWSYKYEKENDFGVFVRDDVRGVNVNGSIEFFDPLGAETFVSLSLRQGLDVGDATRQDDALRSISDGDGVFTKLNIFYSRYQAIDNHWSFRLAAHMQLADEGLLSSEEYNLGGSQFGRGFESGVVDGDNVFAASLELRYYRDLSFGPLNGGQLYSFIDMGSVFNDGGPRSNGTFISSFGGGVRLYFNHGFEASFEVGIPLDASDLDEQDVNDAEYSFRIGRSTKIKDLSLDSFLESSPIGWFIK